jgi:hypothetical protein
MHQLKEQRRATVEATLISEVPDQVCDAVENAPEPGHHSSANMKRLSWGM